MLMLLKKSNNKIKIHTQYSMGCVLLSIYLKLGLDKLWAAENKVGRGLKKWKNKKPKKYV